jgi:hypothetical protein
MLYIYENINHKQSLIHSFKSKKTKIFANLQQNNEEILAQVSEPGYFIFHIDLTKTKNFYVNKQQLVEKLLKLGIKPINGIINNISKSYIQDSCRKLGLNNVTENLKLNDIVIVKSDFNFNNIPETRLTFEEKKQLGVPIDIKKQDYIITEYKNINFNEITPNSVVEKYIQNKDNLFYRVYKFYEYYAVSEVKDSNPIKKMPAGINRISYCFDIKNLVHEENRFLSILQQAEKLSTFMHLDYGTFDVVRSDKDEFYIIDVNTTPFWGNDSKHSLDKIIDHLSLGLRNKNANNSFNTN